jgi:hypothetical protein
MFEKISLLIILIITSVNNVNAETIKNDSLISILEYYEDSFTKFYNKKEGEKKIKNKLSDMFSDEYSIEQIEQTNLFKISSDKNHFFMNPENDFIFIGKILKINNSDFIQQNVSQKRREYNRSMLRVFDLDDFIIYKNKGTKVNNGVIYVFVDFSCPFCKKFHDKNLKNLLMLGYEVRYVPFLKDPNNLKVKGLMENIFCLNNNEDKKSFLDKAFQNKKSFNMDSKNCKRKDYINNLFTLSDLYMFKGTPAIMFNNGNYIEGYVPLKSLVSQIKGNY